MSIKKLFDSTNKNRNYLSDTDSKDAFSKVESDRNVRAISAKTDEYVPQIDYSEPENFARYGSAYLYYKSALEHVYDYYPYDGSDAEITEYYNKLLDIEKHIFNNLYPRTNGYINLSANGWGTAVGSIDSGYGMPTTHEYIKFSGGPHTSSYTTLKDAFNNPKDSKFQSSNLLESDLYTNAGLPSNYATGSRLSNLQSNFDNGVTVEFWLKKGAFDNAKTEKEVIFDMWNNSLSGSTSYGRLRIELTGAASGSPFLVTVMSGASGIYQQSIGDSSMTTASLGSYGFYSLSFYNEGTNFYSKLYVDGKLNSTNEHSSNISTINPVGLQATIGALITSPSGSSAPAYAGKLSASLDEFRFWKVRRNSSEIARYYNTQVRGGTNTDISNTTLGVYFKFNEGITGTSSIDSTVLDYSGRLTNGSWTGYSSTSRNTGSAIVLASAATSEYLDPIIYSQHPEVAALQNSLEAKGTFHDANNNSMFVNMMPSWILEDAENETDDVRLISHIVATYFDKLFLQIETIPRFKHTTYTSASYEAYPFSQHLPQSLGLYSPEIFVDAEVLERFMNRSQDQLFQKDVAEVKNLIYLNLYNSLAGIYKSKGTQKAVRNVLRCFNIDDRTVKLKTYTDGQKFQLKNNLELTVANNAYVNFNDNQSLAGVVFQKVDPSNSESLGYISGTYLDSREDRYGFTAEAGVIFPWFNRADETIDRDYISSSLFGMYEANTSSAGNTAFLSADSANFQVHAVRAEPWSKNVYFRLSSSNSPFPFPELTSSLYFDVYDNTHWNFSVRLKPSSPIADMVTGSDTFTYDLEFRGINAINETIENEFKLTASLDQTTGANFLKSAKRLYVGAQRTNVTGTMVNRCDVNFTNLKYWTTYLNDTNLNQHLYDINNAGISGSYSALSPLDPLLTQVDAYGGNTLGLHWTFDNITGSDSTGNFYYVSDMSSGSALLRDNYGWVGGITGYQHTGYGTGFRTSSSDVVKSEPYNTLKFIDPETVVSSEMISIVGEEEQVFGIAESPPRFYHVVEKSMYQAISEEMLTFFAGVIDFNNIIGEPVNRYRMRYKALEKLREIFFRKVTKTSKVEKFIEYYRWLDDAIAIIISQLMPASSGFIDDAYNIIESHTLERNKYRTQFPTIEFKQQEPEFPAMGINEMLYNWRLEHAPVSGKQNEDSPWWLHRADRLTDKTISSGDTDIDRQRENIRETAHRVNAQTSSTLTTVGGTTYQGTVDVLRTRAQPYKLVTSVPRRAIHGGVNFEDTKNIAFTYNALRPDGPVNREANRYVPLNVLVAFTADLTPAKDSVDVVDPNLKKRKYFKVQHGRDWQDGAGYKNVKSSYAFPFNVLSSSVTTGYNKEVVDKVTGGITITNLHNDVYGEDMEIPLQGPYANYAAGGHQSRHVKINEGADTYLTRPEAWKILLDTCILSPSGAIGMVGPDYPWPESNTEQTWVTTATGDYLNNTKGVHWPAASTVEGNCLVIPSTNGSTYEQAAYSLLFDNNMTGSGTFPEWTFSGWIKPSASNADRTVWAAGSANSSGDPIHHITVELDEALRYTFRSSQNVGAGTVRSTFWETSASAVTNDAWQHIAVSFTGSLGSLSTTALPTLYINGVSQSWDGATSPSNAPYNNLPNARTLMSNVRSHAALDLYGVVMIGGLPANANSHEYQGSMDEIAMWNRKLTDLEVAQVYNSGSPCVLTSSDSPQSASVVGWWRLGEAAGDAINTGATAPDAISVANVINDVISPSASFLPTAKAGGNQGLAITTHNALTGCDNRVYTTRLVGPEPYPMTGSQRAVYYRDFTAKTPYVFKNIRETTSSRGTILGNYSENYQVVSSVGGYTNNRAFVDNPPTLPTQIVENSASTQARSIMDIYRTDQGHFQFIPDYAVPYMHNTASNNKSIIRQRFSSPGGIETIGQGYGDIRSDEYSVYNVRNYRNWTVIRPFQLMSGTISEPTGAGTTGIRAVDFLGRDFGLIKNLTLHSGRFGRNSELVPNPGASYDQDPALVKINRNPRRRLVIAGTSPTTYTTASFYDNFWVQHQIPRSDRQYTWITGALSPTARNGGLRYYGYSPTSGRGTGCGLGFEPSFAKCWGGTLLGTYSSSAEGWTDYFSFVTASAVLGHAATASIYQPALSLNIYVTDPVDMDEDNTLGFSTTASVLSYYNADLLSGAASGPIQSNLNLDADFFNLLMTQRKSTFGYRAAPQSGPVQSPILRKHRRFNVMTITESPLQRYTINPVSNRSQPMLINVDISGSNQTMEGSYNLDHLYFGNEELDEKLFPDAAYSSVSTAEQIIALANSSNDYTLNWVIYRETLFPSKRNEFLTRSSSRVGYDNLYWRNSQLERYRLNTSAYLTNSYGSVVSQSVWPLDAPLGFLTRSMTAEFPAGGSSGTYLLVNSNSAGELQNEYLQCLPAPGAGDVTMAVKVKNVRIAGLYSRKHMMGSPRSVVAPTGMIIPATGAVEVALFTSLFARRVQLFAGSAAWEAPSQAGYVSMPLNKLSLATFTSAPSQPWFNNYTDFNDELHLVSKGFAVVPEFRISEHVEDYETYGIAGNSNFNTFEIPGTDISSNTASFYRDYSNSEFMGNFANMYDMTMCTPEQILLCCTASIRLNPYKGFYPAQRTLDLVKRFHDSYARSVLSEGTGPAGTLDQAGSRAGSARPLAQTLFAPGILYNTIKAGVAVDYPVVTDGERIHKAFYGGSDAQAPNAQWMLHAVTSSQSASSPYTTVRDGGAFWDRRIPFESIMLPTRHVADLSVCDVEPHPSCSLDATASLSSPTKDPVYTKMASNFFGEIGNFFLKNSGYTKIESGLITDSLRFESGSIYGARVKLRRTLTGSRFYTFESGSTGDNSPYSKYGGKYYDGANADFVSGTSYPLPQDPRQLMMSYGQSRPQELRENFTMYSRPSAFGVPCGGRPTQTPAKIDVTNTVSPADGVAGFNWSFTPPYYHGEAWADLIFTPTPDTSYDLEKILSEIDVTYWRVDPGPSASVGHGDVAYTGTQFLPTFSGNMAGFGDMIYDGKNINHNAMQLSASINLFGMETVYEEKEDKFGSPTETVNKPIGKKWIIQPKMETPMLNFNDTGVHPIRANEGTVTNPSYGSGSVPRGMWHQFGAIEPSSQKGIFMEIDEIPTEWLRYHYEVRSFNSAYNKQNAAVHGRHIAGKMRSLVDLASFEDNSTSKKLGQLAESQTLKEAIVAIPYYQEESGQGDTIPEKSFFSIDAQKIQACLPEAYGSETGDSLDFAGESIRLLVQRMQRYVLPPQIDFMNNPAIDPMVMYFFEFEYTLDQDDLSYIWQNLAPRDYRKMSIDVVSTAHTLADNELLSPDDILMENLRWMVFKVKQKSQVLYTDIIAPQATQATPTRTVPGSSGQTTEREYDIQYNWPYDYVSFVEKIKFGASVQYVNPHVSTEESSTTDESQQAGSDGTVPEEPENLIAEVAEATGVDYDVVAKAASGTGVDPGLFDAVMDAGPRGLESASSMKTITAGVTRDAGAIPPAFGGTGAGASSSTIGKSTSTAAASGGTTAAASTADASTAAADSGSKKFSKSVAAPITKKY
jgi:hypothetical protein